MPRGVRKVKDDVVVEEKASTPEVVSAGVVRDEEKVNTAMVENERVRAGGNWKKVDYAEMVRLEQSGKLLGFDPRTGEVLVKEEK